MKLFYPLSIRTWVIGQFLYFIVFSQNLCFSFPLDGLDLPEYHDQNSNTDRLFEREEVLRITILSDFSSIMSDRGEDRSYHKGVMYYCREKGDTIFRKIKLKTRGNFRRDPANCKYPPIMVKFGKMKSADSVFVDQSKLKLVTQCQLENYVLLEYLAYRIYNQLSAYSYKVRLAHVTYADMATKTAYFTRYAFFIENENELAARVSAEIYRPNVVQYFLNRENMISVALFQYMIGNDDWYTTSKHNVSILKLNDDGSLIAVPYDFDWSDMVDASYSKPEGVPDNFLRDRRIYKGLCMDNEEFLDQRNTFNSRKETILQLVGSLDDLPKNRKQKATKYIEQFYKILNNDASLKKVFQNEKCVSEPEFSNK